MGTLTPEIIRVGIFDMQVCVPATMTDEEVVEFARGSEDVQWSILKTGHKYLGGDAERVTCSDNKDKVHMRLES
jgi:hypothetical protein